MIEFYSDLGPVDPEHICQGELKSEVMFKEDKKYHIDLKVRKILISLQNHLRECLIWGLFELLWIDGAENFTSKKYSPHCEVRRSKILLLTLN